MEPYWSVSEGISIRRWSCAECRGDIHKGDFIVLRDGRKIRLAYHPQCFSGDADPRTQPNSSFSDPRWKSNGCIHDAAPPFKGRGKWSVASYGYHPTLTGMDKFVTGASSKLMSRSMPEGITSSRSSNATTAPNAPSSSSSSPPKRTDIVWGFARKELDMRQPPITSTTPKRSRSLSHNHRDTYVPPQPHRGK